MSASNLKDLIELIRSMGVNKPDNPDSEDIQKIIQLYFKNELTSEQFKAYFNAVDPAVRHVMDGLKACINSDKEVTSKVIDLIEKVIKMFDEQIKNATTLEERREIREQIRELLTQAREEADKHRSNNTGTLLIAGGIATVVLGIGLAVFMRKPKLLKKGVEMVSEGVSKTK